MAAVFYKAINQAIAANKIVKAADFATGDPVCDKFAGTGVDAGGLTQRGSGHDDGIYYHDSEEMGVSFVVMANRTRRIRLIKFSSNRFSSQRIVIGTEVNGSSAVFSTKSMMISWHGSQKVILNRYMLCGKSINSKPRRWELDHKDPPCLVLRQSSVTPEQIADQYIGQIPLMGKDPFHHR